MSGGIGRLGARALLSAVVAGALWLAGAQVAAAGEETAGCLDRSGGFIPRLCLDTSPEDRSAELFFESTVGAPDRAVLAAAVLRDIPAVEREFGRPFARPPVVQVFATPASFELALRRLGHTAGAAGALSYAGGALDRSSGSILINWSVVSAQRPVSIIRHELTHLMVGQIVGTEARLPAWFEEGLAVLSRYALAGGDSAAATDDYVAAAVLSTGRHATTTAAAYAVAGSATAALRREIGAPGVVRLLDLAGSGHTFEDAFAAVAGRSPASFSAGLGGRLAELAPPAISVAPPADGSNLTFMVRGFPAGGPIGLRIDGPAYRLEYHVVADPFGMFRGSFGSTAPAGAYAIRATAGALSANAVLRTAP